MAGLVPRLAPHADAEPARAVDAHEAEADDRLVTRVALHRDARRDFVARLLLVGVGWGRDLRPRHAVRTVPVAKSTRTRTSRLSPGGKVTWLTSP